MQEQGGQPVVMKLIVDGVERLAPRVALQHEPLAEEGSERDVQGSAEILPPDPGPSQPPG